MKDILEIKRRHDRHNKIRKDKLAGIHTDHTPTIKVETKPTNTFLI